MTKPQLVMFAGPNGSGKSSITEKLRDNYDLGEYINPDIIAAGLSGPYPQRVRQAQTIAEEKRQQCIAEKRSFCFETVMSHPSKVETLRQARSAGFNTTLFYVCLDHPLLNVNRVADRVRKGGHDVPTDKIISRYFRSLNQLTDAVRSVDNAFVIDNSYRGRESEVIAQIRNGNIVQLSDKVPHWVKNHLMDKLTQSTEVGPTQKSAAQVDAKQGIRYRGKILSVSKDQVVQETSNGVQVVHPASRLPASVEVGQSYMICHGKKAAVVKADNSHKNTMNI
ncbi:zeta toxin family protein [Kistimonas asteriae]|uniref:zeta toxin family protein n=1 Tax=Kistimonas asteriae TaxID=517724 RepID=UPI001BADC17B|nr:zeta toxin family protein [Kistimonas asteriae]